MTARRWDRTAQRALMHRRGVESVHGDAPYLAELVPGEPRRRPPTKEELRRQAEEALERYNGTITKIPTGKRNA